MSVPYLGVSGMWIRWAHKGLDVLFLCQLQSPTCCLSLAASWLRFPWAQRQTADLQIHGDDNLQAGYHFQVCSLVASVLT